MPRAKSAKTIGPADAIRLDQLETEVEQLGSELYVLRRSLVELRTTLRQVVTALELAEAPAASKPHEDKSHEPRRQGDLFF